MSEPKTVAERLDTAENGQQFGSVVMDLFATLQKMREAEQDE